MSPGSVPASEHIPTDILICRPPRFLLAGQVRRCRGCRRPVPAEFPRSPSDPEVGSYRVPASPSSRPAVRRVEGDGLFRTATAWRPPDPGADKGRSCGDSAADGSPLARGMKFGSASSISFLHVISGRLLLTGAGFGPGLPVTSGWVLHVGPLPFLPWGGSGVASTCPIEARPGEVARWERCPRGVTRCSSGEPSWAPWRHLSVDSTGSIEKVRSELVAAS